MNILKHIMSISSIWNKLLNKGRLTVNSLGKCTDAKKWFIHWLCQNLINGNGIPLSPRSPLYRNICRRHFGEVIMWPQWGMNKMAAMQQTKFSEALLWMRSHVFWSKFHWIMRLGVHYKVIIGSGKGLFLRFIDFWTVTRSRFSISIYKDSEIFGQEIVNDMRNKGPCWCRIQSKLTPCSSLGFVGDFEHFRLVNKNSFKITNSRGDFEKKKTFLMLGHLLT